MCSLAELVVLKEIGRLRPTLISMFLVEQRLYTQLTTDFPNAEIRTHFFVAAIATKFRD